MSHHSSRDLHAYTINYAAYATLFLWWLARFFSWLCDLHNSFHTMWHFFGRLAYDLKFVTTFFSRLLWTQLRNFLHIPCEALNSGAFDWRTKKGPAEQNAPQPAVVHNSSNIWIKSWRWILVIKASESIGRATRNHIRTGENGVSFIPAREV